LDENVDWSEIMASVKQRMSSGRSATGGVATAAPTRPALGRMLEIHALLQRASAGKRINCTAIVKDFAARGLKYSTKTIHRDISFMQKTLGLPIEYDRADHSYAYTSPDVTFPVGHDLTADERVALEVARQSLAVFRGVNFAELIGSAYGKLFGAYPTKHGLSLEGDVAQYLSVRTPGAGIVDGKVFRAVVKALLERRELKVNYQAAAESAPAERRLAPYHLACVDSRWVLSARNLTTGDVRTYVLARFSNPRVLQTTFARPDTQNPADAFGSSFGAWTGAGRIRVRLRFAAVAAHHVRERHWHATQTLKPLPAGEVEVGFELSDLNDITRWILAFGGDVEVLEPGELRVTLAEEGRRMQRKHESPVSAVDGTD
jgi:predicted DNA-binding transcriptional regulator YafY